MRGVVAGHAHSDDRRRGEERLVGGCDRRERTAERPDRERADEHRGVAVGVRDVSEGKLKGRDDDVDDAEREAGSGEGDAELLAEQRKRGGKEQEVRVVDDVGTGDEADHERHRSSGHGDRSLRAYK